MKRVMPLLIILVVWAIVSKCQSSCDVSGRWVLKNPLMFENYEQASPYSKNTITFLKDSVKLESGFFYLVDDLVDNFPVGRDPFIYYGKKESYNIKGDSLYIHSKPYNTWKSYKIVCISENDILLKGRTDTMTLQRSNSENKHVDCFIKKITADVKGGISDIFKVKYRVTYTGDDKLVFEDWDSLNSKFIARDLKLKAGTFKQICQGFDEVDLLKLKRFYPSDASESVVTLIEITLSNGKVIKSELRNQDYPDNLRFALIPVLYLHQQLLYSHLPPVR